MEFSVSTTRGQHLLGKVVGDCILEELIGYGGSSAVYLAQPRNGEQKVAVKVFLPRSTMDSQAQKSFYRRFLREAQAASDLDHPHILSIYSYGEHQGLPYIVMPYYPGGTLSDYVRRDGPLSLRAASTYLEQIASALDYAHTCGVVHCDVKPANILLGEDGQVVLSDFGIVRLLEEASMTAPQSTKSPETLMGTPDYISPEQALGEPLDGRSDIYSLAVTLYFLLAGEPPFKSDSSIAMALMHVHEKPPLLGLRRADITPEIDQVIGKALAKWPEERYQTASDFSAAFSEAVSHAHNIDRVAFVDGPPRLSGWKVIGRGRENDAIVPLEPEVRVKPISGRRTLRSRSTLLLLILSILTIAAISVGFVLSSAINNSKPQLTPTPTVQEDVLANNESAWTNSPTFKFDSYGHYHIVNNSGGKYLATALYEGATYTDFTLTVTMKQVSVPTNDGGDYYGVVLRSEQFQSYYLFGICPACGGEYEFERFDVAGWHYFLQNETAPSIHTAAGQSNTIKVLVRGNSFSLYVNNVLVHAVYKDTLPSPITSGEVGLSVEEGEVVFSNMYITPLP